MENNEAGVMATYKFYIFLALVAVAYSGPINVGLDKCADTCAADNKFKYEVGKTYEFAYEADTITSLAGASEEHSGLHMRATANIEVLAQCELALTLENVRLEESDPRDLAQRSLSKKHDSFKRELEARPLRFSFQDGRVEHLCASEKESQWVLNAKRGVLSAFQNSMDNLEDDHKVSETDVGGECDAEYKVANNGWRSWTVTKSKNLLGCSKRNQHATAMQAMPYRVPSDIQSLPLVNSVHNCEQTITSAGILSKSECHETHTFRPFSNQDSGATTKVRQSLEFQSQHQRTTAKNADMGLRTSILFEHEDKDIKVKEGAKFSVEDTLREICATDDIRPESPRLFSQLVHRLRYLPVTDMKSIHKAVQGNRLCQDNHQKAAHFLHDAVPMVGTPASVSLIGDMVSKGRVSGMEAETWVASLAFVQNPTGDMINSITDLMTMEKASRSTLLSASTLVHSFCSNNECESNKKVLYTVNMLTEKLGHQCKANTPADNEQMILVLKTLGNMGVSGDSAKVLARCAGRTENSMDMRLAAMDAFRRMSCEQSRADLMSLFKKVDEDSEVRIAAYLSLMRCPTEELISAVRNALQNEEINQVGSFIWTHLTNLMETSSPLKQDIRNILEDETLKKEFDLDVRKFSRNYEGSFFINSLNTGAQVESNLIWSQESYIPRSANLNLTVDLFGQSVNLLEIGGRAVGLESLVESVFGPEGYFPDNAVATALSRSKRAAGDENINRLHEKYSKETETPKGSAYMRVFGNELGYMNIDSNTMNQATEKFNLLEMLLQLAEGNTVDLTKSVTFIDSTVTIPTMVGMPLKLAINGTASVSLQAGGKLDMRQFPRNIDIDGFVKPSGAIEISSMMSVDAFVAKSGLKMESTLHSSTQANLLLQMSENEVLKAKVNMPKDKIEFLNAETKFFIVHGQEEREQKMLEEGRVEKKMCSCEQTAHITGLQLCGEMAFPSVTAESAPYFPFTGPVSAKLHLNKVDTHTAYEMEARLQTIREKRNGPAMKYIARLGFNTPGSEVDREMLIDFQLNKPQMTLNAELRSPWKKATLDGALSNTNEKKSAILRLLVDGDKELSLQTDFQSEKLEDGMRYNPSAEIRIPGRKPITASGSFTNKPYDISEAELTVDSLFSSPVSVKGTFSSDWSQKIIRLDTSAEVRSPIGDVKGSAFIEKRNGLMRNKIDLAYGLGDQKERVTFNSRMKEFNNKKGHRFDIKAEMTTTQFPDYNARADIDWVQTEDKMDTSVDLRYGEDFNDKSKRIFFTHGANFLLSGMSFSMDHTGKFVAKPLGIQMNGKLNHRHNNKEVKTQGVFSYRPGKKINLDLNLNRELQSSLNMNADISLTYPGRVMRFVESLQEVAANKYHHELSAQWQKGSELTSTVDVFLGNGVYDANVVVTPPSVGPLTLSVTASPKIDDFTVKAKVEYDSLAYSSSLTYSFDHIKQAKGSLDIQYPDHHIKGDALLSKKGNTYNSQIDFEMDNKNKMSLDGEFSHQTSGVNGHMKVSYADNKYKVSFDQSAEGNKNRLNAELSWDDKRIIVSNNYNLQRTSYSTIVGGDLMVKTPFTNFEKIQASANFKKNRRQLLAKSKLSWATDKSIDAEVNMQMNNGLSDTDSFITLSTPFTEDFKAAINYNLNANKLTSHMESSLGMKKVEIDLNGALKATGLDGSVQIRTPFPNVRDMQMTISHNMNTNSLKSQLEGSLMNQKITLDVNGVRSSSNLEGSITLKTPFLDDIKVLLSHNADNSAYESSAEVQWQPTSKITANFYSSGYAGKATLTTPFKSVASLGTNWEIEMSNKDLKANTGAYLNNERIRLNIDSSRASGLMSTEVTLQTPLSFAKSVSIIGSVGNNNLRMAVQRNGAEEMTFTGEMNMRNMDIDANAQIHAPFLYADSVSAKMSLNANSMPYSSKMEVSWASGQKISLENEISLLNGVSSNSRLSTPFSGYENIVLIVNHIKDSDVWTSGAELEYSTNKKIEVSTRIGQGPQVSFSLKTPCRFLKTLSGEVNHDSRKRGFNNMIAINYEADAGKFTFNSKVRPSLINMKINTPISTFEEMSLGMSKQEKGSMAVYDMIVEYQTNKKIEVELNLEAPKGTITIKTPFRALRKIVASLEHNGGVSTFENKVSFDVTAYNTKSTFESNMDVKGLSSISGNMQMSGAMNMALNINHNMDDMSVATSVDMTVENQKSDFSIYLATGDKMSGRMSLTTPLSKMLSLSGNFEHTATQNHVEIRHTTDDGLASLNADLSINGLSSVDGRIEYNSPYMKHSVMSASIGQESAEWVCKFGAVHGEAELAFEGRLNIADKRISIDLKSPFSGLEDITSTASYTAEYGGRVCRFDMQYSPEKKISTEVRASVSPTLKLSAAVNSPCQYVKNMQFNFEHAGKLSDFHTTAELSHNLLGGKIISDVNFKVNDANLETSFDLKTPFTGFELLKAEADFKMQGAGRFYSALSGEISGNKMSLQSQMNLQNINSFDGQITYTGMPKNINFNFNHNGNLLKFNSYAELNVEDMNKSSLDVSFNGQSDIRADVKMSSPFIKDVEFTLYHQGHISEFQNQIEVNVNGEKSLLTSSFRVSPEIEAKMHLATPFTEDIDFSLTHQGDYMNFQHVTEMQYAPNKKIQLTGSLAVNGQIKSKFQLRTPFSQLKNAELVLSHTGSLLAFDNDVRVVYGENEFSYIGHLAVSNPVEGRFVVKMPNMESIIAEFNHAATNIGYTSSTSFKYASENKIELQASLVLTPGISGSFSMKTPFTSVQELSGRVSHVGKLHHFECSAEASYNNRKMLTGSVEFAMKPAIKGRLAVNTPFESMKDVSASFDYDGNMKQFSGDAVLKHNSQVLIQAGTSFKASPATQGDAYLRTIMGSASLNFAHEDGRGNGAFKLDDMEIVSYNGVLSANNGQIVIKTAYPAVQDISASFNSEGSVNNFNGDARLSLNGNQLMEIDGDLNMQSGLDATVSLKTAHSLLKDVSASIAHQGNLESFNCRAELSSNGQTAQGKLTVQTTPRVLVTAELITPFSHAEKVSFSLNHQGSINQFTSSMSFSSDDISSLKVEAAFNGEEQVTGRFSIETPFSIAKETILSFNFNGDMSAFQSGVQFSSTYLGSMKYEGEFTASPVTSGNFRINAPVSGLSDASLVFSHVYNHDGLQSRVKVSSPDYFDIHGEANLKTAATTEGFFKVQSDIHPIRDVVIAFNHEGNMRAFRNHAEMSLGQDWKIQADSDFNAISDIEGSFRLQTPYSSLEDMSIAFNHKGLVSDFSNGFEFVYNSAQSIKATSSFSLNGNIQGDFTLETPSKAMRNLAVRFTHSGPSTNFNNEMEVNVNNMNVLRAGSALSVSRSVEGSFSLEMPIDTLRNLKVVFKHDGFKNAIEMQYNDDKSFTAETDLSLGNTIEGSLTLSTPFKALENMVITFNHEGIATDFSNSFVVTYNNGKTVKVASSLSLDRQIEGIFRLETPFAEAKDVIFTIKHRGTLMKFNTFSDLHINGEECGKLDIDFKTDPKIDAALTLITPFTQDIVISTRHQGRMMNFRTAASASYGSQAVGFEVALKLAKKITGSIKFSSPFIKSVRDVEISINHKGSILDFETIVDLVCDDRKMFNGKLSFDTASDINMQASIESAFQMVRNADISFTHKGGLTNFETETSVNHNGASVFQGKTTFRLSSSIEGSVSVAVPQHALAMTFNHRGQIGNFKTEASLTHNGDAIFTSEVSFMASSQIKLALSLTTATDMLSNVDVDFSHNGGMMDFQTELSTNINQKEYMTRATFQMTPTIEATLKMKTPFERMNSVELIARHRGDISNFQTDFTVNHNSVNKMETTLNFQTTPSIEATLTVTSPFASLQTGQISFGVEGAISNFKVVASAVHNGNTVIDTQTSLRLAGNINGAFSLKAPLFLANDVSASISHNGNMGYFQTNAEATMGGDVYQGTIAFNLEPFSIRMEMKTPFDQLNEVTSELKYKSNGKEHELSAETIYDGGRVHLTTTLKQRPLSVSITFGSPFQVAKEISLEAFFRGGEKNLESSLEMKHNGESKFKLDAEFKNYARMNGNFRLQSTIKHLEDVSLRFRHSLKNGELSSQAQLQYAPSKIIASSLDLKMKPRITGQFTLQTPFESMSLNNVNANIDIGKTPEGMDMVVDVMYANSQKMAVRGSLNFIPHMQGDLRIQTPFTSDINGAFNVEQTAKNVHLNADAKYGQQAIVLGSTLTLAPYKEAHISLQTPFKNMESLSTRVKYEISTTGVKVDMQTSYSPSKTISANMELSMVPEMRGEVSLQTPFTGMKDMSLGFKHIMDSASMTSHVEATYDTKRLSGDINLRLQPELQVEVDIMTPFTKDMSLVLKHNMDKTSVASQATASYGSAQTLSARVNLRLQPTIEGDILIQTPFSSLKEMSFGLKHEHTANGVISHVEASYSPSMKYAADINMKINPTLEGEISIETPFADVMSAAFSHKMTKKNMQCHMEVSRGSERIILGDINLKMKPAFEGHIQVLTPLTQQMSLEFSHKMDSSSILSHVQASYSPSKVISGDLNMKFNPDIDGELRVQTPFRGFENTALRLKHMIGNDNMKSTIDMFYGNKQNLRGEVTLARTERSVNGAIKMNTPFRNIENIGAEFQYENNVDTMEGKVNVQFASDKLITVNGAYTKPERLTISVQTPFSGMENTVFDASFSKDGNRYEPHVSLTWNTNRKIEAIGSFMNIGSMYKKSLNGNFVLRTPFQGLYHFEVEGQHMHSRAGIESRLSADFNMKRIVDGEVQYSQDNGRHTGAFIMRSPLPLTVETTAEGDIDNFNGDLGLSYNTNQNMHFQINHQSSAGKRLVSARLATPVRTMVILSELEQSEDQLSHKVELNLDEASNKVISHQLTLNTGRGSYGIRSRLDTPIRSVEAQASHAEDRHAVSSSLSLMWDAAKDQSKKIELNNHFEHGINNYRNKLSLALPKMQKDLVLRNELTLSEDGMSGRAELEYSPDPLENLVMNARVQKTDKYNYSLEIGVSHPRSQLDANMVSHIANDKKAMSAGMEMKYKTADRKSNNMVLRGEIEKLRQRLKMQLITPVKTLELNGKMTNKNNIMSVRVVATEDNNRQIRAEMDLNSKAQTLDMKTYYSPENPDNVLHLFGKFVSPTSMTLDAYRQQGSRRITESQVNIEMRGQKLLHSKLYWRPNMISDIQMKARAFGATMRQSLTAMHADAVEAVSSEVAAHLPIMMASVPDIAPMMTMMTEEAQALSSDMDIVSQEWNKMYHNNEFFIQNIDAMCRSVCNQVVTVVKKCESVIAGVGKMVSSEVTKAKEYCSQVVHTVTLSYNQAMKNVTAKWEAMKEAAVQKAIAAVEDMLIIIGPYVEMAYTEVNQFYTMMNAEIQGLLAKVYASPAYIRLSRKATAIYRQMLTIDLMKPVSDSKLVLSDNIRSLTYKLNKQASHIVSLYSDSFEYVREWMVGYIESVMAKEQQEYVQGAMKEAYFKAQTAIADMEIQKNSQELLQGVLTSGVRFVKRNALYFVEDYLRLGKDRIITYNPAQGEIEFELYMPVSLPELQTVAMPGIDIPAMYNKVKSEVMSMIPEIDWDYSVWDTYYKYKPSMDISNWIPPFKTYAAIAGNQHFMTFDKKFYEFSNPCSYLLASDFVGGKFSVAVNYNGNRQGVTTKSFTVMTGEDKIEILSDYRVTVNGAESELPVEIGATTVLRSANTLVLDSNDGLRMICKISQDLCTVELAGWYFGKTAGLLGTYNNEIADDLTKSDRSRASTVEEFAASWKIGKKCPSTQNFAVQVASDVKKPQPCKALFEKNSSPLRPCFRIVDTEPFMRMCANDMESNKEDAICKSAAMYVRVCRKEGVRMVVPKKCSRCERPGYGSMEKGESVVIGQEVPALKSADVVFVVEEKPCNKELAQHLKNMAVKMEISALRSKGLKNNQFGLVGFGGAGVHDIAHSHTIDGQLLNDARKFRQGLDTLSLESEGETGDAIHAIKKAAKYPFRAGASKTIILVTCSTCQESRMPSQHVQDMLKDMGITLHVLREHAFEVQDTETPKSSFLFGVDANTAYTSEHVSDEHLAGDVELSGRVARPDDNCAAIAHATGGSFFDVSQLTSGRVAVQKRFTDVFVRRIAKSAEPALCQTCTCETPRRGGDAKTVCRPCL